MNFDGIEIQMHVSIIRITYLDKAIPSWLSATSVQDW